MLRIEFTRRMKRDAKRMQRRGKDMGKLTAILDRLARREALDERHRDHQLSGALADFRECHIEPDWLLMYQVHEDVLILSATATGTHADLFDE
ncbi:MAG: type II toxin-antitoxin system YafQ family toxin [Clostridia bacterium]|nr:type II toxin-antitoxin system YafQ family toxin [Clostridia bacterium]